VSCDQAGVLINVAARSVVPVRTCANRCTKLTLFIVLSPARRDAQGSPAHL
jgi:hypothetical protein